MEVKEYYNRLGQKLISSKMIQRKIKEIAKKIQKDYMGKEIVLVSNLKGSFRFLSDLVSHLRMPVIMDFIAFASYKGTSSSNQIRIIKDLKIDIRNKHVILIEDIIDTGKTLSSIIKYLNDFKFPETIKVCTLLDKASVRTDPVIIDYKGFEVDDLFIVGYGLDYDEYYRELNDIFVFNND